MASHSFISDSFVSEWNAVSGELHAVRSHTGGRSNPSRTGESTGIDFQAVASVRFAGSGHVCAVDVPELPECLAPAIPKARGKETVGHAWLDSGWLWIPLSHDPAVAERTGLANIALRFDRGTVAGLTLRLLQAEETP